ncbi:hypothetical protein [Streptomyces sp. DT203]|uniref:hypothetical protein n=1 Tax=Streptomyces sp. DT203 TaxID=3393424 RepID=UPI003CF266F7
MTRARALAARHPASYACWDLMQHPDPAIGDTRTLPCTKRRTLLLGLLAEAGPPIQSIPATDDRDVAEHWYKARQAQGIEGVLQPGFGVDRLTTMLPVRSSTCQDRLCP